MKYTWEYKSAYHYHKAWEFFSWGNDLAKLIKEATPYGDNDGSYKPGDKVNSQRIKDSHKKVIWLMENGKVVKDLTGLDKPKEINVKSLKPGEVWQLGNYDKYRIICPSSKCPDNIHKIYPNAWCLDRLNESNNLWHSFDYENKFTGPNAVFKLVEGVKEKSKEEIKVEPAATSKEIKDLFPGFDYKEKKVKYRCNGLGANPKGTLIDACLIHNDGRKALLFNVHESGKHAGLSQFVICTKNDDGTYTDIDPHHETNVIVRK